MCRGQQTLAWAEPEKNKPVGSSVCLFILHQGTTSLKRPAFVYYVVVEFFLYCYFLFLSCKFLCLGVLTFGTRLWPVLWFWSTGKYACECPPRLEGCQALAGFPPNPSSFICFPFFYSVPFCFSLILDSFMCSIDAIFYFALLLLKVHTLLKGLEKIAASANIPMLVCGDFNAIPGRSVWFSCMIQCDMFDFSMFFRKFF